MAHEKLKGRLKYNGAIPENYQLLPPTILYLVFLNYTHGLSPYCRIYVFSVLLQVGDIEDMAGRDGGWK